MTRRDRQGRHFQFPAQIGIPVILGENALSLPVPGEGLVS